MNRLTRTRRSSSDSRSRDHGFPGFTLIEVLISILILGLGLLGLGALFPAVIREQRLSTDRVSGLIAENNLRAELPVLLDVEEPIQFIVRRVGNRVEATASYAGLVSVMEPWTLATGDNPMQRFSVNQSLGLWEPAWNWQGFANATENQQGQLAIGEQSVPTVNVSDADYLRVFPADVRSEVERLEAQIRSEGGTAGERRAARVVRPLFIPASERINLGPGEGAGTPSMVWDIVLRRVPVNLLADNAKPAAGDQMQVAVFVRRIDPGIRVPFGETLRGVIAGGTVRPIGVGSTSGPDANQPTFDGSGVYSLAVAAFGPDNGPGAQPHFRFVDTPDQTSPESFEEQRRWVRVLDVTDPVGSQMAQVGQRLIDNLGNVYTVERVEPDPAVVNANTRRIRLNPTPALSDTRVDDESGLRRLQQFVFTPQVPVAAFVLPVRLTEVSR